MGVALSVQSKLRCWPPASSICIGQGGDEGERGFLSLSCAIGLPSCAVGLLPPLFASAKKVKREREGLCSSMKRERQSKCFVLKDFLFSI